MCARSRLRSHHPPPRLATSPATVEPNTRMAHLPLRSWSSPSVASAPGPRVSRPHSDLSASSACPRLTRPSCAAPAASWRVGARSVASTSSRAPGSIARSCAAGKAGFPASVARWPCCDAQQSLAKHDACRFAASIASSAMPRFLLRLANCMMRCGIAAGDRRGDRRETARFPGGSCCAWGWGVGVSA